MSTPSPALNPGPRLRGQQREQKITEAAIGRLKAEVQERMDRFEKGIPPIAIPEPKKHRERIMWISQSDILNLIAGRLTISNIPEGAELISSWQDPVYDGFVVIDTYWCLRMKHESFPEVDEGRQIREDRRVVQEADNTRIAQMIRHRTPLKRTPLKRSACKLKRGPIKKKRSKQRRVSVDRNQKYKDWLKDKPCAVCGKTPSDPAHCGKNNGMASKGPDSLCAPLCRTHHSEHDQGKNGKRGFEEKYDINMREVASRWYQRFIIENCFDDTVVLR